MGDFKDLVMAKTEFARQLTRWKRKKLLKERAESEDSWDLKSSSRPSTYYKEKILDKEWFEAEARARVEAKLARGRTAFNMLDHDVGQLGGPFDGPTDIVSPDSDYCADPGDEARSRSLSEIS